MHTQPPFTSAQDAWFWTASVLQNRQDPQARPPPKRDGRADDVLKCLDELYRRRRIELLHARILHLYGRRGRAPDPRRPGERCDWRLWREAMDGLGFALRRRGLVQAPAG